MRKTARRISLTLALLTAFSAGFAQITEPGLPPSTENSRLKSAVEIPVKTLKKIDADALIAEDVEHAIPNRYSVFEEVKADIRAEGVATALPDGNGTIWRYRIHAPGARSVQLFFSEYQLPDGARLFLYNDDMTEILGAFTNKNNNARNSLMIADFPGESVIIEYAETRDSGKSGKLVLGAVGKAYRDFALKSGSNADENGFINVNCSEGADWQNEKHAVCRFSYQEGGEGYLCSGALINNVLNDGTPYFLTANHCLETESAAATVVAYFNYEYIGCDGPMKEERTLSGATLLATAGASDYTLLLFNNAPPADYQPFYAGWDASGEPGNNHVGIHHPGGNAKKISLADSAATSYPDVINWVGNSTSPADSHWEVLFNNGLTSTGSSGSPLFNEYGRIIGQLHGGSREDYYGRLDYSWDTPSDTDTLLKYYLDPGKTGTLVVDGYYPPGVRPDPLFVPEFRSACHDAPVQLFAYSAFDPESWNWSIEPSESVVFLEGTDAQSRNPVVSLGESTYYDVTLSATNAAGDSSQVYEDGLNTVEGLLVNVYPKTSTDSCLCNFDSIRLVAAGARDFTWELDATVEDHFGFTQVSEDTVDVFLTSKPDTATSLVMKVTGLHGECTAQKPYILPLIMPSNDSVHMATEIFLGENGPFSNKCAGIQENEPVPPFISCTGQASWCDEYGTGEDIVENSIWFYFIPQDSAYYKLTSAGMDNQTAIWEAETAADLLSGNRDLVGANDDITSTDFNAVIKRVRMDPGKKYWIQADGSAGGSEGTFTLDLELLEIINSTPDFVVGTLRIYPQPAGDRVRIEWDRPVANGTAQLEIFNASGATVYDRSLHVSGEAATDLNLSGWEQGIYFLRLKVGNHVYHSRMVK